MYIRAVIHRFDTYLTTIITSWPAWLKPLFLAVTALGDPIVTIAIGFTVVVYGYWQSNVRLALAGAMVWLTLGIGTAIKLLIGRQRPVNDYSAHLQTLSFPSGHTSGATIAYGLLAYLAWHLLPQPWNYIVVGLLIGLIVLVGISRIYLGAHFPSDVVAGWLLGVVALAIVIFVLRPLA